MTLQLKPLLAVVFSLAGLRALTFLVSTAAAEQDEREGRRADSRVRERGLRSFERFLDAQDATARELYRNLALINEV
jgi:hypothetical protein